MMCESPKEECHFNKCTNCPGFDNVELSLRQGFEKKRVQEITFNEWKTTDRCQLDPTTYRHFKRSTDKLKKHDFIAKTQNQFLENLKQNLEDDAKHFIVLLDFSENYSTVVQDAVQAQHWSKEQATIHPYVIYRKNGDKIEHESFIIISDCLEHDANTVYAFQTKLISFLKKKYETIAKITYFSDGAAPQYKNKSNFSNLAHHFEDFGIQAEWHFFATSHGKSPCDGVGGTLKRLATQASLQKPISDQITSPQKLYQWAIRENFKMNFEFCSISEVKRKKRFLTKRFSNTQSIAGTRSHHAFIPIGLEMQIKLYSLSNKFETIQFCK